MDSPFSFGQGTKVSHKGWGGDEGHILPGGVL